MIVLDASAVMAYLLREAGHEVVAAVLEHSAISAVNLSEVLARLYREGIEPRELAGRLAGAGVTVVDFDSAQAVLASKLREDARRQGMGLADCCCLALALHKALPVVTADRAWHKLGIDVEIRLIR